MFWSELAHARGPQATRRYVVAERRRGRPDRRVRGARRAPATSADVQTIAVARDHWGTGLGARLLTELLRRADRRSSAPRCCWRCRVDNARAQKLYERFGFEPIGFRRGYYQPGNVDALVMRLTDRTSPQRDEPYKEPRPMADEPLVLGIETSCDETGVGIVRGTTLLADAIASSVDEHARFGGVVPEVASPRPPGGDGPHHRARPEGRRASARRDLDGIAVTAGPGLAGALLVGVSAAKAYAYALGKPLYGVNHLASHICVDQLEHGPLPEPTMALLVSGGHSSLLLAPGHHLRRTAAGRDHRRRGGRGLRQDRPGAEPRLPRRPGHRPATPARATRRRSRSRAG